MLYLTALVYYYGPVIFTLLLSLFLEKAAANNLSLTCKMGAWSNFASLHEYPLVHAPGFSRDVIAEKNGDGDSTSHWRVRAFFEDVFSLSLKDNQGQKTLILPDDLIPGKKISFELNVYGTDALVLRVFLDNSELPELKGGRTLKILTSPKLTLYALNFFSDESLELGIDVTCTEPNERSLNWFNAYSSAEQEANRSGKALFIFFTGKTWCGPCKRLKDVLLDSEAFRILTQDRFVLLEIDVPAQELPDEVAALMRKYDIISVPALLIVSPKNGSILQRLSAMWSMAEAIQEQISAWIASEKKN